ncbi:MAG: hypothetical protein H0X62_02750 [Bacteroidetes bacterium]|nr:hypothetical protein [Bacteroidota bacterium]
MVVKTVFIASLICLSSLLVGSSWYFIRKTDSIKKNLEKEIIKNDSIIAVKLMIEQELDKNIIYLKDYREKIAQQNDYINSIEQVLEKKQTSLGSKAYSNENIKMLESKLEIVKEEKEKLNQHLKNLEKENNALKGKFSTSD